MNLIDAVESPRAFRGYFRDLRTWSAWITFSKVLTGDRNLTADEMELFRQCTGLTELPPEPIRECYIIAGRRSGKSTWTSLLTCFYSIWGGWKQYLSPGEKARVFVVATNKQQAQIIRNYVEAFFDLNDSLRRLVKRKLAESIELEDVIIEIKPASWRTTRGFTVGLLLMEELAYWRYEQESANPDSEIYLSIKPGMATIKNSLTIGISTPFARQGLLYQKFQKHFGRPGNVLIWRAPSWVQNHELTEHELEAQYREKLGESAYLSEFACHWREDIEGYLPEEIVARAIVPGRYSLPYDSANTYVAFVDSAELLNKSGDSMCLAISHIAKDRDGRTKYALDLLEEVRPPASPKSVIEMFAARCKEYHINKIIQDRVSLGWIASDFREYGIEVEACGKTKSQLYELFSVLMNKDEIELLDNERLRNQIAGLEKRQMSGGISKIDHYPGGKDDCINVVAGVCLMAKIDEWPLGNLFIEANFPSQPITEVENLEAYSREWLMDRLRKKTESELDDEAFLREMKAVELEDRKSQGTILKGWRG